MTHRECIAPYRSQEVLEKRSRILGSLRQLFPASLEGFSCGGEAPLGRSPWELHMSPFQGWQRPRLGQCMGRTGSRLLGRGVGMSDSDGRELPPSPGRVWDPES